MNKFEVSNMDLYYGSFHALKNININIPEREITAFIGPSGCGKSTFLKSLNRMNDLVEGCRISGDIKLDGVDIYKDKMDVNVLRKRVGMVFQKPNPFPMSIYDNIAYGPRTHGVRSKARLDEIVEKSLRDAAIWDEVKDRLNKSALGMSGGQQRAQVAAEIRQHGSFQRAEGGVAFLGLLRVGHVQAVVAQFGVQRLLAGGVGHAADGLALGIGGSIAETWHRGETSEG